MSKPRILDLFSGAGGAAVGYHRAGFEVVGVDIEPQPRYPFVFCQEDALYFMERILEGRVVGGGYTLGSFAAIHASPPCQAYTRAQKLQGIKHPDLIVPTRNLLEATGLPYIIENVPGAPLRDPVVLEGQMFEELRTIRPRWFEANWPLAVDFMRYGRPRQTKMGRPPTDGEWLQIVGHFSNVEEGRKAMGIDWMTRDELKEAIPPAYSQLIGHQLMQHVRAAAPANTQGVEE